MGSSFSRSNNCNKLWIGSKIMLAILKQESNVIR